LEHGVMQATSVDLVAGVLRFFVLGLVPFSLFQLLLRAFYALQDTKTPFLVNCCAVAVNTAVNVPMFLLLKVEGLAAGHALSYIFGVTLLARALRGRVGGLDGARVATSALRIGAAGAGMGLCVWAALHIVTAALGTQQLDAQLLGVIVPVAIGVGSYLLFASLLKVEELNLVRSLVRRRMAPATPTGTTPL
jgi:putative peptidoglycan lipid II flippase